MADVLSQIIRSKCMSAVRSKDTKPEWTVRRIVFSLGYRYRLHQANPPGKPDVVFSRKRKAIFVHGCFWHRHCCKKGLSVPSKNREFWQKKLGENVKRDERVQAELRRLGWTILVVWECQTTSERDLSAKL